jgi:NhaP-type Na+/H+ or K+/H+ antiporter
MSFLGWMGLCGGLLLLMALSSAYLRRLPVSTSAIYLGVGLAIGPLGFGWLRVDLRDASPWIERLTEVAVVVSLFVGGLKLRLPVRDPAWRAAFRLAGPVMLASILGVALVARVGLGRGVGGASPGVVDPGRPPPRVRARHRGGAPGRVAAPPPPRPRRAQ